MKPLTMSEEREASIRETHGECALYREECGAADLLAEVDALRAKLAASQARERDLLHRIANARQRMRRGSFNVPRILDAALAAPTDDSALRGLMRAAWKDGESAAKECPDDDLGPACEEYVTTVLGPGHRLRRDPQERKEGA